MLVELGHEDLPPRANRSKEARLDISALNFWTAGQRAFFDPTKMKRRDYMVKE